MRFAIYARKSTESEDRQVQSLEDQIRELKKLAVREKLAVVELFQESRSAKAPNNRPEFDRLMKDVDEGKIDGVLCWSINRLSRNPVDGGRIAYLLQTGKLSMIRTIERTYLPDDNALLLSIENGMATAYIQDLARNVKRGMRGKLERGWMPAKAPVGYRNDADSREIVVDRERFSLVRDAWEMLLTGDYSVNAICEVMDERGLTIHSKKRSRGAVSRVHMYNVFRNPFYMGKIHMFGETVEGKHAAMVTPEEFEQARSILSSRHRATRKATCKFDFHGVFRCSKCGCHVIGERKTKTYLRSNRTVIYTYYHCSGSKGCAKQATTEDQIVELAKELARDLAVSDRYTKLLRTIVARRIEERYGTPQGTDMGSDAELEKLRQRLDRLITMRADGEISLDDFERLRAACLSEINATEDRLGATRNLPVRIIDRMDELLETGEMAREITGLKTNADRFRRFLLALGPCLFDQGRILIEPSAAIKKIAAFEPVLLSSWNEQTDDFTNKNSFWWSSVDDLLTLVERDVMQRTIA